MEELEIFLEEEGGEEEITLESENVGGVIDVQVDGKSVVTNGIAKISLSNLEKTLQDILEAIQQGGTTSMVIEEIEQIIVSYFENKTVEEVER